MPLFTLKLKKKKKKMHENCYKKLLEDVVIIMQVQIKRFKTETTYCEGCFCNNATWRAESGHDMDFNIEKGVAEPKT